MTKKTKALTRSVRLKKYGTAYNKILKKNSKGNPKGSTTKRSTTKRSNTKRSSTKRSSTKGSPKGRSKRSSPKGSPKRRTTQRTTRRSSQRKTKRVNNEDITKILRKPKLSAKKSTRVRKLTAYQKFVKTQSKKSKYINMSPQERMSAIGSAWNAKKSK